MNNVYIINAQDLFWEYNPDIYKEISKYISDHVGKYIHPKYFQSGFAGDDLDGCIDYASYKPAPKIDPMQFEIDGKNYTMRFSAPPNTIVE